ncbi:MAG: hypothetical protein EOL98_11370 [Negativicutes bacterium]|nr:hypothetical protein [Negativicutes bacterium]
MCGLVALFAKGQDLTPRIQIVKKMMESLAHRGPDSEGMHHVFEQALFGHRRLAIIDLEHGTQPMCSRDGRYTLVYNGEIYNYIELARELQQEGLVLDSLSDTEVLLQLLIQRGSDALLDLNGMFAFVFHDRKENRWLAARDHFGIKPLYYTQIESELVFTSEIKAILSHPNIRPVRDERSLHQYLALQFCLDDRTLFKDTRFQVQSATPSPWVLASSKKTS